MSQAIRLTLRRRMKYTRAVCTYKTRRQVWPCEVSQTTSTNQKQRKASFSDGIKYIPAPATKNENKPTFHFYPGDMAPVKLG